MIELELRQSDDDSWSGDCTLHYHDKSVVKLAPIVGLQTRDLAKDKALEDARVHIDNAQPPMPHHI